MKRVFFVLILVVIMLFIIFVILIFPVFIKMDDSVDLGNNYRYIQDYPQTIVHYENNHRYKGVGKEIVPPLVLLYVFNEQYIIAKSQELDEATGNKKGKPNHYWIIDKAADSTLAKPMDSIAFYQQLKNLDIGIELPDSR